MANYGYVLIQCDHRSAQRLNCPSLTCREVLKKLRRVEIDCPVCREFSRTDVPLRDNEEYTAALARQEEFWLHLAENRSARNAAQTAE